MNQTISAAFCTTENAEDVTETIGANRQNFTLLHDMSLFIDVSVFSRHMAAIEAKRK